MKQENKKTIRDRYKQLIKGVNINVTRKEEEMKYDELIEQLELNEEQQELVKKFQQSTEDKIRTDYSKQIKALEDTKIELNTTIKSLTPVEKSAEQIELENTKNELSNLRFKSSLKDIGVNDGLVDYLRSDIDLDVFKGVYESIKPIENTEFIPTKNQSSVGISKEEFKKMGIAERTKLYEDSPELYEQLTKQ